MEGAEIGSASRISTLMARARQDWDRCQPGLLFSLPESPRVSPSARAHFLAFLRKQFPILAAGKLPKKTLKLFPFLETLHNDYVINQVCTAPSLPEPSLPPVSHSHKGRSRVVVADKEEDNEANWNPPSSAATTFMVPGLTYEEYERGIRHDLRKKQKSQGESSNPDQAPEAGSLLKRASLSSSRSFK
ncbi:hypothetical protein FXO38_33925 [Capsicum annuum]|nr:hypothetical protein FXO38_33925 [Capsicum annuum]